MLHASAYTQNLYDESRPFELLQRALELHDFIRNNEGELHCSCSPGEVLIITSRLMEVLQMGGGMNVVATVKSSIDYNNHQFGVQVTIVPEPPEITAAFPKAV